MEINEAIGLLKQALAEIEHLRTLRLNSEEFDLWHSRVSDILEAVFGNGSPEYERFLGAARAFFPTYTEVEWQQEYSRRVDECAITLQSIIKKYERRESKEKPTGMAS